MALSIRCITLGTRPYIESNLICQLLDIEYEKFFQLIMNPNEYSVAFVRTKDGLFVEESAASLIIERNCTKELFLKWKKFITNNNAKRRLTESEKKAVAADQDYTCAMCKNRVREYEIDHIEQDCIRHNNSRTNLQCLCPSCHRLKTRLDRQYADCLFEAQMPKKSLLHGANGNIFSAYFHK